MGHQVIGEWRMDYPSQDYSIPVSGAEKARVVILRVAEKRYVSGHEFLC